MCPVFQEEMRRRVEEKVALALQKQGIQKVDSAIPTVCLRVTPVLPSALVSQNAEELSTSFYIKIWRTVDDDFRDGSVYQVAVFLTLDCRTYRLEYVISQRLCVEARVTSREPGCPASPSVLAAAVYSSPVFK